jgi:hypothetical protein
MENRILNLALSEGVTKQTLYGPLPVYAQALGTNVEPEQVSDYEATWSSSWFDRHFTAEVTGYQMELSGLMELNTSTNNFNVTLVQGSPVLAVQVPYGNDVFARLRGLETVLTLKPIAGTSIQVNHTYEDVYSDPSSASLASTTVNVAGVTPWNKLNLIARTELLWGFNASAQLGWEGSHYSYMGSRGGSLWIPDQAIVNVKIGFKPTKDVELYVVGSDLQHETTTEGADGVGIAQMYSGGLSVAFGN